MMNSSNNLSNINESGNTGDGSSGNRNENISAEDINDNCMDEFTNIDSQTEICSSFNNSKDNQTQELQSQLAMVHQNIESLSLPHQDSAAPTSKRVRTRYTTHQIYEMEQVFKDNFYIGREEKRKLAERLNLDELKIKIWFQNRRTKEKKIEQNPNQSQNNKPTIFNGHLGLNVQLGPMNYNNANNTEINFNSRVYSPIQQFHNYEPLHLPSPSINVYRNNSQPIFESATNLSGEYVRNIGGYPFPTSLNYFENNQSGLQGILPPQPPQVVSQTQFYQYYNQLYGNFQNLPRPHLPPQ